MRSVNEWMQFLIGHKPLPPVARRQMVSSAQPPSPLGPGDGWSRDGRSAGRHGSPAVRAFLMRRAAKVVF